MLEPWAFAVAALAAYRLTRFLVFDSLVGSHLDSGSAWSRRLDVLAYTSDGKDRSFLRGKLGDLLTCPYCVGFWVSLACWAGAWWGGRPVQYVLIVFAVAGVQAMLSTIDRKLS